MQFEIRLALAQRLRLICQNVNRGGSLLIWIFGRFSVTSALLRQFWHEIAEWLYYESVPARTSFLEKKPAETNPQNAGANNRPPNCRRQFRIKICQRIIVVGDHSKILPRRIFKNDFLIWKFRSEKSICVHYLNGNIVSNFSKSSISI